DRGAAAGAEREHHGEGRERGRGPAAARERRRGHLLSPDGLVPGDVGAPPDFDAGGQSDRRAARGSVEAARHAGYQVAPSAAAKRSAADPTNESGSSGATWYSIPAISRVSAIAASAPATTPPIAR